MHASEVFRNSIICEVPGIETVVIGNWPGMGKCSVRTGRDGDDEVCNFRLHDDTVTALACHPTEKLVASAGSRSSRICFWNPTNAQLYASIDCASSSVYSVGFAADGKSIAFGRAAYTAPNEFSPSRARAFLSAHNWSDYPFMWGSLRANKYANPLERGFSLEKMTPDEGVGFSDADLEESGWHRELLKLNEWEVDKYASPRGQPVDQNKDQIIVMRSGREVTRFHCPNSLPANTCTLTRIDGTNKAALIVAYGGARVGMFDIETHRLLCEFTGCQSDATSLAVSPDFQYLVAGGHDHVIRIWSLRQPAKPDTAAARSEPQQVPPLLSILATDSGQWVAWTENGFYTCSPGADDLFGWQVNHGVNKLAEFHPAESFKAALYRPDLVKTILNSHGDPNVIPERLTVQQLLASSRPPIVQITKPHHLEVISRKELDLQALISHPPELPIQAVEVVVNGKSTRALSVVPTLTDGKRYAETVTLTRGVNNISVRAFGPGGIVSAPQLVTVTCTASDATTLESGELPSLYLLAIGVSEHQNSQLNLDYAAKDALDMAALWESQKGKRFQSVRAKTLVNEQATSVNVLSALRDLQDAGAGIHDFAMIFVSGHGIQDVDGEYRFVTADADLQETENTTVHWDAFQKTLRRLPSHNILLLDTCHAGAAVGHESIDDRSTDAYNNILRNAASADSGYITFASCLPHEKSLENPEWKNGAFTLSIVEGFSGKADTNRDRTISISEIETYASQRVEVLSRGQQRTALFKSITIPSNLVLVQF